MVNGEFNVHDPVHFIGLIGCFLLLIGFIVNSGAC